MRSKTVLTKNIARLNDAGEALLRRAPGMPGMGLVHGETGFGKSTAIAWYINRPNVNGVYVRALSVWTPAAMFSTILQALGRVPRGGSAVMVKEIIEQLLIQNRPLFIDEADYIINSKAMTESLRDLHDMALVPVVLIGMAGIDQRLAHRKQLINRVMQDVRFEPSDMEDARKVTDALCEVKVRDDLLELVLRASGGNVRNLVVGLQRIEHYTRSQGLDEIGANNWPRTANFFTGNGTAEVRSAVTAIRGAK